MRLARGNTLTLISVTTGVVAAVGVALAWLPVLRERDAQALDDQASKLELMALLAADRVVSLVGESEDSALQPTTSRSPPPSAEQIASIRAPVEPSLQRMLILAEVERVLVLDGRLRLVSAVPARPAAVYGDQVTDPAIVACKPDLSTGSLVEERVMFREGNDGRRQAICLPLQRADGQSLGTIVVVGDSEPVLRDARRPGRDLLVVMGLASAAGLAGLGGMRRLLAPLSNVSRAAARIASGERDVRVEVRGTEEMKQLAHAMNALASSVESREDEIGDRMRVVHQLSRMVAHEVRNPLQSLSLLVTLARTEPDPPTRDGQLALIEDEIQGLERVVQRFLSQSGPLRVVPVQTDLVEVLERAAAIAHPRAAARGVRLRVHGPARLPVMADGTLVRRALENLLLNAIEFAGTVPGRPGSIVVSLLPERDQITIVVDDDGPGVPVEMRERIFEPDVSAKPGGIGLGLALVRQVFDAHQGYIRCEESPMKGARFIAGLPRRHGTGGEG